MSDHLELAVPMGETPPGSCPFCHQQLHAHHRIRLEVTVERDYLEARPAHIPEEVWKMWPPQDKRHTSTDTITATLCGDCMERLWGAVTSPPCEVEG